MWRLLGPQDRGPALEDERCRHASPKDGQGLRHGRSVRCLPETPRRLLARVAASDVAFPNSQPSNSSRLQNFVGLRSNYPGHVTETTVPVVDPISLRVLIQQKLADGRLPHNSIPRVSGGPSSGETCDACGDVIAVHQFVMEGVSMDHTKETLHMHVACFYLWDAERKAPGR